MTPALTREDFPLPDAPTRTRKRSVGLSGEVCSLRVNSAAKASRPKYTAASSSAKASSPGYGTRSRGQSACGGAGFSNRYTTTWPTTIATTSTPIAGTEACWMTCNSQGASSAPVA